jgi:WD40 repeat protein
LSQIEVSVDGNSLLDTATDCLRFVTEFFEVISQSAPHIYHSALQLVPQSSIIWELYSQQISSPIARVVTGVPASWDSCTASAGVKAEDNHAVWSPCGKFLAVGSVGGVEIRDSNTLEELSTLRLQEAGDIVKSLAFSPNGCLLACIFTFRDFLR